MSGVFSMASHWVLQNFPVVIMHEQTGWAHFSGFEGVISFSPIDGLGNHCDSLARGDRLIQLLTGMHKR
jgi:hypothetical protein